MHALPERRLGALLRRRGSVHFDLDGVLLDSNRIKVGCMADAIAGLGPAVADAFVAEFERSFGRNRREHFLRLHRDFLGGEPAGFEDFFARYGGAYAALVAARYPQAEVCEHARELLAELHAAGIPMTVVTGTPGAEAEAMLERHGLRGYFRAVLGGEFPKRDQLREVLRMLRTRGSAATYLGDSASDMTAADAAGLDFIFVERYALDRSVPFLAARRGEPVTFVRDLAPDRLAHLPNNKLRRTIAPALALAS